MILIFVPVNVWAFQIGTSIVSITHKYGLVIYFRVMCTSSGSLRILQRALTTLERRKLYVYIVNCQCGCVKLIFYTNRQLIVVILRTSVYAALATHNYTDECTPLSESLSPFQKLKNLNGSMLLKWNYVKVVNYVHTYISGNSIFLFFKVLFLQLPF